MCHLRPCQSPLSTAIISQFCHQCRWQTTPMLLVALVQFILHFALDQTTNKIGTPAGQEIKTGRAGATCERSLYAPSSIRVTSMFCWQLRWRLGSNAAASKTYKQHLFIYQGWACAWRDASKMVWIIAWWNGGMVAWWNGERVVKEPSIG